MTVSTEIKTGSWSDEEIEYLKNHFMTMSHEEIGKELGRTRNAVRHMCSDLKLRKKEPKWTKEEEKKLKRIYKEHEGLYLDLDKVAEEFGRTRYGVAMKASRLGFSAIDRPKSEEAKKLVGENTKNYIKENGHPKGMLGKTHSDETKKIISEKFIAIWNDPKAKYHTKEFKTKRKILSSKTMLKRLKEHPNLIYSNAKRGKRFDLGDHFFRSRWEANIARYLNHLKETKQIYKWEFESETFKFSNRTERPYSYTPDFKIWQKKGGTHFFYEVKGWMDELSKKKLKLVKMEYPNEKIELIDEDKYNAIEKQFGNTLPNWEQR